MFLREVFVNRRRGDKRWRLFRRRAQCRARGFGVDGELVLFVFARDDSPFWRTFRITFGFLRFGVLAPRRWRRVHESPFVAQIRVALTLARSFALRRRFRRRSCGVGRSLSRSNGGGHVGE